MHYKGKVVDTPVAPITSTGKSVKDTIECDYTPEDGVRSDIDKYKGEGSGSKKSSY